MAEHTEEKYTSISPRDIEELKAIYEDYLYMARQHELQFNCETVGELSFRQVQLMYPECKDPRQFVIPWYIKKLNAEEQQEFADYIGNNIKGDGHKTYISIQHIKAEENNGRGPLFAIEPYANLGRTMQFPSMIEEYILSYPEGATFGNTEFYIDGYYKTAYLGDKAKDRLIADCINDPDLVEEINMMLNLGECFRKNGYVDDEKFGRMAVNVYATGAVNINENNLLEILGSFAEKVKKICHDCDHNQDDDLSNSFQDYMNIRNLMRHQWDTLDDLDGFTPQKARINKRRRAERVNSYLKFCDKTLYQRMISYIEALHQMQKIIGALDNTRIIRDAYESNNKFAERVKIACRQNPDRQIEVEMNYPFGSEKYKALNKILHKNKIFPNIKIVDDLAKDAGKLKRMLDYQKRSLFLRDFHDIASYAMGYCQRRGEDKEVRGAWNYLAEVGVISPEECQKWHMYTTLRNVMAHDYFDENIITQLNEINGEYIQDFQMMAKKLYEAGPDVTKIRDDVFKYQHADGKIATLNYASYDRQIDEIPAQSQEKTETQCKEYKSDKNTRKEVYNSGIEFKIADDEIVGIKLPNDVYVNMNNHSISWGNKAHWYSNSEVFNALQTEKSTIRTDKELKITSFFEGSHRIPFGRGDNLLVDYRHRILLDRAGRLSEFNFKNSENKMVKTKFNHFKSDHSDGLVFEDGTNILLSDKNITVIHDNKVLSYETRKEFAMTYTGAQISSQQFVKHGNER